MWERDEDRLALFELLRLGRLRRRRTQAEAWALLAPLNWTRTSGRRHELELVEGYEPDLRALLERCWPDWERHAAELDRSNLPPTPKGWRELQDLRRAAQLGELPDRLNRRTATSAVAPHSKATLSTRRRAALGDTEITCDGAVRLRPPPGLRVIRGATVLDATTITEVLGEVVIPERALRDGTRLAGPIKAVLLVENLGPYQDLDPPTGWMVIHVPGWNTATVLSLLQELDRVPVVHFGDLDPAGLRIVRHLRALCPHLRWAIPGFWIEYVNERAITAAWPDELELDDAPELVRELARRGLWLEQESIVLDPRLGDELMRAMST